MSVYEFSYWVHSTTGAVHLIAATVALVIGPIMLLRRKGDRTHRNLGFVFATALLVVDVTALITFDMTGGFNMFHALALLSLAALLPGLAMVGIYARWRNPKHLATHAECMVWAYYGVLGAGVAQLVSRGAAPTIGGLASTVIIFTLFGASWFITRRIARIVRARAAAIHGQIAG